ncbi:hypothetical protein AB0I98_44270, partial [Streptomyces sp. NPDC050211]
MNHDFLNRDTAIGILCDDQAKFDETVDYFHNGAGNGSLANAVSCVYDDVGLAQWQESGRDQAHSLMGITTNTWKNGPHCVETKQTVISEGGRGHERSVWEQVYHHYAIRRGMDMLNTGQMVARIMPEGGGGDYGPNSGGYDQLGFGALAFTRDKATTAAESAAAPSGSVPTPAAIGRNGSINFRCSSESCLRVTKADPRNAGKPRRGRGPKGEPGPPGPGGPAGGGPAARP